MALRVQTVEYAFAQRITSLAAATRHDFAAITLYLPETTSRTFRSVYVEVTAVQNNTTATNLTSTLVGIKLGATAFTDTTVTQTFTNTGEINNFGPIQTDVTSYFTSNFGAAGSQTCQVGVQFGGAATINITAKIIITYEYSDADTTRVKTVRIPIESQTGALTTTSTQLGTSQIPALTGGSGLLPEASVTIRQIWFECEMNDGSGGTTDWQHELKLDSGGSADTDGLHEAFDSASKFYRRIWEPTISDTTVTHGIYVRTTNATSGPCPHQAIVMHVTYEYDASTTTTVLNSVVLAFGSRYCPQATSSGDKERYHLKFLVSEPGTITLKQSGVKVYFMDNSNTTFNLLIGGQTVRAYTHSAATTDQSGYFLVHRFDSGAAQGSGLSIARGVNTLVIDSYSNATNLGAVDGLVYLNYTSDDDTSEIANHQHTTRWLVRATTTTGSVPSFTPLSVPNIPETSYYLNNTAYKWDAIMHGATTSLFGALLFMEMQSGELEGAGWKNLCAHRLTTDAELMAGGLVFIGDATDLFNQYPGDPKAGCDIETSRGLMVAFTSGSHQLEQYVTHGAITFTKSGTVSNYQDADGAGLIVKYFRSSDNKYVGTSTTTSGGAHSFTWYDDVDPLFAVVLENSSHCGASWTG